MADNSPSAPAVTDNLPAPDPRIIACPRCTVPPTADCLATTTTSGEIEVDPAWGPRPVREVHAERREAVRSVVAALAEYGYSIMPAGETVVGYALAVRYEDETRLDPLGTLFPELTPAISARDSAQGAADAGRCRGERWLVVKLTEVPETARDGDDG